jgi:hypothetical protein
LVLASIRAMFQLVIDMSFSPLAVFDRAREGKLGIEASVIFGLSLAFAMTRAYSRLLLHPRSSLTFFESHERNVFLQAFGHPLIALLLVYLIYAVFVFALIAISKAMGKQVHTRGFIAGLISISAVGLLAHLVIWPASFFIEKDVLRWASALAFVWVVALTVIAVHRCLFQSIGISLVMVIVPAATLFFFSLHLGVAPYLSWLIR